MEKMNKAIPWHPVFIWFALWGKTCINGCALPLLNKEGQMTFTSLAIPEVILITPDVWGDSRGYFLESYHQERFRSAGMSLAFVQDNHSQSQRGVIRGLHYQKEPHAQAKLVRVVQGAIFDVAVDLRPGSKTFGKWVGERLDAQNHRLLYIPTGFAHGFCALENQTQVLYKVTDYYAPDCEQGIRWNDSDIQIAWPKLDIPYQLSAKDQGYPVLREIVPSLK
jgi:dTDP-4-dehydrorhamnose 3,5-epimerase